MNAPEALAFDMYGTLVDPIRIWTALEDSTGPDARRIAEIWRQKQLEYSFRLTVMERYEDFEWVTRRALDHALAVVGRELSDIQKAELLARYDDLETFPDVLPGLGCLRQARRQMVVSSNGSPRMLTAIMRAARLEPFFDGFVSVDEVRAFKPSPRVYRRVTERLGRPPAEVRLVSSNPFDVVGAEAAGLKAAWINRGGPFDWLGPPPDVVVASLAELADVLDTQRA
jgi:2-haloacid dehalogenase